MMQDKLIPKKYGFIFETPIPPIMGEALKEYGTEEFHGEKNNPKILMWAREIRDFVGIEYSSDATPWCGLAMGVFTKRAGYEPPFLCIRAKEWLKFGLEVKKPTKGDILVFNRNRGGHVGLYVAEDEKSYYTLGGNQNNELSIVPILKSRLCGIRRPPYAPDYGQTYVTFDDKISKDER